MNIIHDGPVAVATGKHRDSKTWKNETPTWSQVLKRISKTHRTHETVREYHNLPKPKQDEIKDVGGFVGGYLAGGRRKAHTVLHRSLITLDLDHDKPSWDDFTLLYGCAAAMYSTHKHTPDAPRLRLIIPLAEEVNPEQYQAIARRIAGDVGIEYFDVTTFQPSRLMYWPSTSSDGEFLFEYQDGEWLDPAKVLSRYRHWEDSSEWPVSERVTAVIRTGMAKAGDPLEKKGIIGAFCRSYTIHDVIREFLSKIYEPCDNMEDRYTYLQGSTAGGLVTYDDVFAYSHHGTDPVSGRLCNAFDLVRLHKFGLQDEGKDHLPVVDQPSYRAMTDFATELEEVRRTIGVEQRDAARADFAEVNWTDYFGEPVEGQDGAPSGQSDDLKEVEDIKRQAIIDISAEWASIIPAPPQVVDNDEWLGKMDANKKGYEATTNNFLLILRNDPALAGRFGMDEFEGKEAARCNLPWRKVKPGMTHLIDSDDAHIRHYIETHYKISSAPKLRDAMDVLMMENRFHPVRDFLLGVKWDGTGRLDTLLIDYLGAEDNLYVRTVTRKTLVAAVARVMRPGCKFDNVLVLIGPQGAAKSTLVAKLGGPWFSDTLHDVTSKDALEQLQGSWILELAELSALKRGDVEAVKHFTAKREDKYRAAYGRRAGKYPRQGIFIGTGNTREFLKDQTGNRRFWPVDIHLEKPIHDVFSDMTFSEVQQIWAEAVSRYKGKESLRLDKHVEAVAKEVQRSHMEQDDRLPVVQAYLEKLLPENWEELGVYERRQYLQGEDETLPVGTIERQAVCAMEVWCEALGGRIDNMTRMVAFDVHNILKNIPGWELYHTKKRISNYGIQRAYVKTQKINS